MVKYFLWVPIAILLVAHAAHAQKGFSTGQPNSWVNPTSYAPEPTDTTNTSGGYYYLLLERQHHAETREMFKRYAIKVLSEKGLQFASSISESYDPSFQSLTFHTVNVIRKGQVFNRLDKNKFKVIQREESLDRSIYDGSLSAILDLEDVQVGDIVEYAYSIKGQNPLFHGKFFNSFYLNYGMPSGKINYRILASSTKNLIFKYFITEERVVRKTTGNLTDYSITVTNPKVVLGEDGTPNWYETSGRFEVSEFSSNQELGNWAKELFDVKDQTFSTIRKKIEEIKKENPSIEKQVAKVIQFVQDEIRYLSLSEGISAYKPHPPTQVFDQRFGDCKDKSLLLTSMLKLLGVSSTPVLVNAYYGKTLNESLPSPWNFNHCIVKMDFQDSSYWIDPTISYQRGSLKKIYIPSYYHGLDVTDRKLLSIPFGFHKSTIDVHEKFTVEKVGTTASLEVLTTYFGDEAVSMRIYKESNSQEEIDKAYVNFYASDYPNIALKESVVFEDDAEKNILKTKEKYSLDPFWNYDSAIQQYKTETYARILAGYVKNPETKIRKNPFSLSYPLDIRHSITLHLPEPWTVAERELKIESAGFSYASKTNYQNKILNLSYAYKTKREYIEANQVKEHLEKTKKIFEDLTFQLTYSIPSDKSGFNWQYLIIFLMAMATAGYCVLKVYRYDPPAASLNTGKYEEIGGWLILFSIGLVLSPFFEIYSLFTNDYFNPVQWSILTDLTFSTYNPTLGLLVIFEMVGTTFFLLFSVLCIILFFKRRTSAPKLIIAFTIASLVFMSIDVLLGIYYFNLFTPEETWANQKEILKQGLRVIIWVPYFIYSDRVKGTFTQMLKPTNSSYP